MNQTALDQKLNLIRTYLEKQLVACVTHEGARGHGSVQLLVAHGMSSLCAVQVSGALLADPHVDVMELRWALKERDIATQVRGNGVVPLTHETLRIGDLGAMGRRPRSARSRGH